ncbi:MAG TPA: YciI family protein [Verrucomicrobiae bacterium]|nr:YciI family protein [Verrucomicrobiae bacterium]
MNTKSDNGYMLLFRGTDWQKGLSPAQMQQVADQWMAWFKGLVDSGTALAGNPLEREGRVVSNGRVCADGPFVETKETIAGYFLLKVKTMAEAEAIARKCPGLPFGAVVEVRPVAAECPLADESKTELHIAQH